LCAVLAAGAPVDHVEARLDEQPCRVRFFERWGSYQHPVTLHGPLTVEEAYARPRHQRAWFCGEEQRLLWLETVEVQSKPVEAAGLAEGFHSATAALMAGADALRAKEFVLVGRGGAWAVRQSTGASFRYAYSAKGTLLTATITNVEGKVSVLRY
jgi:hypothetical protein